MNASVGVIAVGPAMLHSLGMELAKTVIVCGYGPGISDAVARRFGGAGFAVALIARTQGKLDEGVVALSALGVRAKGFACDLGDPAAILAVVAEIRASLPPITVIHWNAYAGGSGDLLTAESSALRASLDVGVVGLVAMVQATREQLAAQPDGAVLVTGGGFASYSPELDSLIVQWRSMGLAVVKAAQRKLVGLLHVALRSSNVYVGEVVVLGSVKGTAFDSGGATVEPAAVADKFWELYSQRDKPSVDVK
jgi:short-subunit dehydrogenase